MSNTFENVINNVLEGEMQKNAQDFVDFLKANEMTVGFEIGYKGKVVCYMHLDGAEQQPGPWTIWWNTGDYINEYDNAPVDERLKEIAQANVNICGDCGGKCSPGTRRAVFGKEFENVCTSDIAFCRPDAEALECVKKLLEIRKNFIDGTAA